MAVTADGTYVSAQSDSILLGITNASLMDLAKGLGIRVEQRPIPLTELPSFTEVGAVGTSRGR